MRLIYYIVFISCIHSSTALGRQPTLSITTHEEFCPIELKDKEINSARYGRLMLFSNYPLHLRKITLRWKSKRKPFSPPIIKSASLYEQRISDSQSSLESSYVACGKWNPSKQTMTFSFAEPHKLVSRKRYSIVITYNPEQTIRLINGSMHYDESSPLQLELIKKADQ